MCDELCCVSSWCSECAGDEEADEDTPVWCECKSCGDPSVAVAVSDNVLLLAG